MKADILRRAEEVSDSEDEGYNGREGRKGKGVDVAFEDELDDGGGVKVRDGEDSSEVGSDDEVSLQYIRKTRLATHNVAMLFKDNTPLRPETICELTYINDPKVFDRDQQTRRSKARNDLRTQTGTSSACSVPNDVSNLLLQAGQMNRLRAGVLCWNVMFVALSSLILP